MNPDEYEIVGENYHWLKATAEVEDQRDRSRRSDDDYSAMVDVYEDRVRFWFLDVARQLVAQGKAPGDYVALSIALAYIEGVEQYRRGRRSKSSESSAWFTDSVQRVFPSVTKDAVDRLWTEARCGLFHDGFTRGRTIVSHDRPEAIEVVDGYLRINPAWFVEGVIRDFADFLNALRKDPSSATAMNFKAVWEREWNAT